MILFVGQVGNGFYEREAFQEIDYRRMFGQMAKWVAQIDRTDRIPEFIARAFSVATSGRPRPSGTGPARRHPVGNGQVADLPSYTRVLTRPGTADLDALRERLEAAHSPFLLVGGSGWTSEALAKVRGFAERFDLPVGVSCDAWNVSTKGIPTLPAMWAGACTRTCASACAASTCLLTLGARLGEATTEGYSVVESPRPRQQTRPRVRSTPTNLGRVFQPTQAICASNVGMAEGLATLSPSRIPAWGAHTRAANAAYRATLAPLPSPSAMSLDQAACHVNTVLPAEACITVGAGKLRALPRTATASSMASAARSHPPWAAWATACQLPLRPSLRIRNAPWSATRATAASR